MPEIVAFDHAPSHREYLAQETVNCRLDRVPMAEGCGGPDARCATGTDCIEPFDEQTLYEGNAMPPADVPQFPPVTTQQVAPTYNQVEKVPLRAGFGDRYRARGGTDQSRRMIQESNSQASRSVKRDSQNILDLLKTQR